MEKEYKLTISILASNRKDTLPKCLESLMPLLDNVSSELIVTDTGCDEDLLKIIKKYTGNIVKFKWCNDFAMARNIGLNMARGQWFMYIDDDEWFGDVWELVHFFNGSEEEEYVAANYVVRNYHSMEGHSYSEGVVGRIFRIDDNTRFEGKIHECVKQTEGKVKQFKSFVHHYGYVFDTEEKQQAHFVRNTSMLAKEIEENPSDARYYAHIYQEYRLINEPDIALEYAMKALEYVDELPKENQICLCSTYACVLWSYSAKKEYESVIKWGEKFLKNKPMTGLTKAAIMSYMAESYLKSQQYERCMECANEYIRLRDMYKDDKERYYKELGPMLNDTFSNKQNGRAISSGLGAAIELEDIKKSFMYILSYDWSKHVYMIDSCWISRLTDLMAKMDLAGNNQLFRDSVRVFGKLFTHIEASNIIVKRIGEIKETNREGYMTLCNVMSNVAGQYGYKELVSIITAGKSGDIAKLMEIYKLVLNADSLVLSMEKEFYEVALDKGIPLGKMICDIYTEQWVKLLKHWSMGVRNRDILHTKKYMDKLLPKDSVHMILLEKQIVDILESRKSL